MRRLLTIHQHVQQRRVVARLGIFAHRRIKRHDLKPIRLLWQIVVEYARKIIVGPFARRRIAAGILLIETRPQIACALHGKLLFDRSQLIKRISSRPQGGSIVTNRLQSNPMPLQRRREVGIHGQQSARQIVWMPSAHHYDYLGARFAAREEVGNKPTSKRISGGW